MSSVRFPNAKWTKLQKEYVRGIENNLEVVYSGEKTRKDADIFIRLHEYDNAQYMENHGLKRPPSGKQLRYIKDIERILGVEKFTGRTSQAAHDYIALYYMEVKFEISNCFKENPHIEAEWNKFTKGYI